MCPGCGKIWTALQVLWSTVYVVCGAAQLIAGIFFTISIPALHLTCNVWTGSWNVIIGIAGGMLACFGQLSPRRQEFLLYMAISILTVNCVNIVLGEWGLHFTDMPKLLKNHPYHMFIDYACFTTRIATTTVIVVSFLDSQFAFCAMQTTPKIDKKTLHGSHEQVSDIEYIIPRPKSSSKPHTVYNAYAQSWVFDADTTTASTSRSKNLDSPYLKVLQNGKSNGNGNSGKSTSNKKMNGNGGGAHQPNGIMPHDNTTTHLIDNPVVHIEEASDDSTSNSDRKLCHMKSFSCTASPVILSASSSHISLNYFNQTCTTTTTPPIYECLEKLTEPTIYRSRLNTALSTTSNKEDDNGPQYQAPQQTAILMRRIESISPQQNQSEKVQYASLMKELQRAIVNKKEPSSITSPLSTSESATVSDNIHTDSSRSDAKSSDAEFSKELEAALQLIQDLESPNTIDTPSDSKLPFDGGSGRPLAVWRNSSDASESDKTLSAVGSLAEIASPLNDLVAPPPPELYTFKPPPPPVPAATTTTTTQGKIASVIVRCPDSQSTSGYSSPTHVSNSNTPNWSTTSSISGSNTDIVKPVSYSIHNAKSTTVISLYSAQTNSPNHQSSKGKSITLVNISGDIDPIIVSPATTKVIEDKINNKQLNKVSNNDDDNDYCQSQLAIMDCKNNVKSNTVATSAVWNVRSLLRKKKQSFPKLCPELEGAIFKSESLAYLSDLELLARHQRNNDIHREIEERVIQQLGTPRTESNC